MVLARKAGWNVADQAMSALTNAALAVVVARVSDASGFGAFSVAFLVFSLSIGIGKALVGQPMSIRHAAAGPDDARRAAGEGLGMTLALSLPVSTGLLLLAPSLTGSLHTALVSLALVLPGLLVQDTCRMIFFAQGRAHLAAANDAMWGVLQFATIGALIVSGHPSLRMLILAWGLSAAACAVIACTQLRVWPRLSRAVAWVHEHRGLSGFLLADYLVGTGAFQGGLLAVGAYLGTAEVGALRGAQVLVGPLGILAAAASTFLIPELSKRSDLRRRPRVKLAHGVSTALTMTSLAYTTVLVLLPGAVGTALLGDSWLGTDAVLLPVALGSCAAAMSLGPATLIYAAGRARQTFRLRVLEAPILTGCLLGGAHLAGATGAAWGICVNFLVMTPMWFHQGWRAVRPNGPSHRAVPPRPASPRPGAPRHAR